MWFCPHPEGYLKLFQSIYGQTAARGLHRYVKDSDFVMLRIDILSSVVSAGSHILSEELITFKMNVRHVASRQQITVTCF